jgi:hypothetical protein
MQASAAEPDAARHLNAYEYSNGLERVAAQLFDVIG